MKRPIKRNISPEELIQSLRNYYAKHGELPSSNRLGEVGLYARSTYMSGLGCESWGEVVKLVNIPYAWDKGKKTRDELIRSLVDYYNKHGEIPPSNRLREAGLYHRNTYIRRLGCKSWIEVLKQANISYNRSIKTISKDELIRSLVDYQAKFGRIPRTICLRKNGLYSYGTYLRELGCTSWAEVLKQANISLNQTKDRIDRTKLIKSLVGYYEKNGKIPPTSKLVESGLYMRETYLSGFGCSSWAEVMKLVNIPYNRYKKTISRADLIRSLVEYYDKYGEIPSTDRLLKAGLYMRKTYLVGLGCTSWAEVMKLANIPYNGARKKISDEELIQSLVDYYDKHGKVPHTTKLIEAGLYTCKTYVSRLGCKSWIEVLKLAGIQPSMAIPLKKGYVSRTKLIESLVDYYNKHGKIPSSNRLVKEGLYTRTTYMYRLGCSSWAEVMKLANIPYNRYRKTISKDDLIRSLVEYYNKHGKMPSCKRMVKEGLYARTTYMYRLGCSSWAEVMKLANIPYKRVKNPQKDRKSNTPLKKDK